MSIEEVMISNEKSKKLLLSWCLGLCGIGWALSFLFLFWSWDSSLVALGMMGARDLEYDPFLHYWMRVIAAIFGCFGIFCFVIAVQQLKFAATIPWVGWTHVILGVVAVGSSLATGMQFSRYPTLPAEYAFFWTVGITLVVYSREELNPEGVD